MTNKSKPSKFMDPEDLRRVAEFVNSQRPSGEELPDTNAVKSPISASKPVVFQTDADYSASMKILKEHGLRPLTYQEALVAIDKDPELKKQLKGKWFYLEGKCTAQSGYHSFDDNGELKQGHDDTEKTVYVYEGNRLSLAVNTDLGVNLVRSRFGLYAGHNPPAVFSAVLGVSEAFCPTTQK